MFIVELLLLFFFVGQYIQETAKLKIFSWIFSYQVNLYLIFKSNKPDNLSNKSVD